MTKAIQLEEMSMAQMLVRRHRQPYYRFLPIDSLHLLDMFFYQTKCNLQDDDLGLQDDAMVYNHNLINEHIVSQGH